MASVVSGEWRECFALLLLLARTCLMMAIRRESAAAHAVITSGRPSNVSFSVSPTWSTCWMDAQERVTGVRE